MGPPLDSLPAVFTAANCAMSSYLHPLSVNANNDVPTTKLIHCDYMKGFQNKIFQNQSAIVI